MFTSTVLRRALFSVVHFTSAAYESGFPSMLILLEFTCKYKILMQRVTSLLSFYCNWAEATKRNVVICKYKDDKNLES